MIPAPPPPPPAFHNRRDFVRMFSAGTVVAAANRLMPNFLTHAAAAPDHGPVVNGLSFPEVGLSREDKLMIPDGFEMEVLLRWQDVIGPQDLKFGDHNDFMAFILEDADTGWLWVNHENSSAVANERDRHPEDAALEARILADVGGSCLRLKRDATTGRWRPVKPSPENFRMNGLDTVIPLVGPAAGSQWVGGAKQVTGSVANCSGGISPWGTFFSGEENYQDFYGEPTTREKGCIRSAKFSRPPEHYGWLVEIDPRTREIFKHTSLGRFSHENVAFAITKDGRLAAYMGDDKQGEHIYKFLSSGKFDPAAGAANRRLLLDGVLHAADTKAGKWIPLHPDKNETLKAAGWDLAKVCAQTRQAARAAGATPQSRPEDVEIHPETGEVFVALTAYAVPDGDGAITGAVLSIREKDGDAGATEFVSSLYLPTGLDTGLVWQDNLTIAPGGALLVTTDYKMHSTPLPGSAQEKFGNNQLFVALTDGPERGKVRRFAVAPCGAEFCSPTLSPDGSELWVNVQHPGEAIPSKWPDGGAPKSALVAIRRKQA